MAGQILGERYRVEKQLGYRAGRWTLLATDLASDRSVILKLISVDEDLHPDTLRLFESELMMMRHLQHPSIPQYLGYFDIELPRDRKALVLVESYISGTSAEQYLRRGRTFSEHEARRIAAGVLSVLVYLHGQSPPVLHRDIKPSSILFATLPGQQTRIYLVNFGSIKPFTAGSRYSTVLTLVGTPGYAAPEQLAGRVLQKSDLYGLGMSLTALIGGWTPDQIPRSADEVDLSALGLSHPFAAWLKQLISADLSDRPASAQAALEALQSP